MAKGKGGGNNYRPIKNPELLGGKRDGLTPEQQVAAGMKLEARKDGESFQQTLKRNPAKVKEDKFSFVKDLDEKRNKSSTEISQDIQKNLQKDKEKDKGKDIDHDIDE